MKRPLLTLLIVNFRIGKQSGEGVLTLQQSHWSILVSAQSETSGHESVSQIGHLTVFGVLEVAKGTTRSRESTKALLSHMLTNQHGRPSALYGAPRSAF